MVHLHGAEDVGNRAAWHQAAGATAGRQSGRSNCATNPRQHSELGIGSSFDTHPLRAVTKRLRPAPRGVGGLLATAALVSASFACSAAPVCRWAAPPRHRPVLSFLVDHTRPSHPSGGSPGKEKEADEEDGSDAGPLLSNSSAPAPSASRWAPDAGGRAPVFAVGAAVSPAVLVGAAVARESTSDPDMAALHRIALLGAGPPGTWVPPTSDGTGLPCHAAKPFML